MIYIHKLKKCRSCNTEIMEDYNFCFQCVVKAKDIELSNLERWLKHLDNCKLQKKGKCPNQCLEGQYLVTRTLGIQVRGH